MQLKISRQAGVFTTSSLLQNLLWLGPAEVTGDNWVKNLLSYINCFNLQEREELGWKSLFEIYFGRKANELLNEGQNYDGTIDSTKYTRLHRIIRTHTSGTNNGRETQRKPTIELLEEFWIVMQVKIYISYINMVIRCLLKLAEKRSIDKVLLSDKGNDSKAV